MTYNIRLDIAVDGENAWLHRKDSLVAQLQTHEPDIIGTQEGLPHQIAYIDEHLPSHDFIGDGRDGGATGEYSAIFYDRTKFFVAEQNTFWLSATPDQRSKGWDAAYIRICTYGLFTHRKTGEKIWVFNTHLDNEGAHARARGMQLILEKIDTVNTQNYPVVFIGDFNAEPGDRLITDLSKRMDDSKQLAGAASDGPDGTFNAFQIGQPAARRIDYIWVSKSSGITVEKYVVLKEMQNSRYPSDHFPVVADLKLN